jgi:triphosphoribosyl-dephospho-CoA synthetase
LPKGDSTRDYRSQQFHRQAGASGQAGKLAAQLKNMAKTVNLRNVRVLTDLAGDFNNVVMEHEVESASEFEELITKYSSDPQAREAAKGYTDLWTTGRRELFRVA